MSYYDSEKLNLRRTDTRTVNFRISGFIETAELYKRIVLDYANKNILTRKCET